MASLANFAMNTFDSEAKWAIIVVPGIFGSRLIDARLPLPKSRNSLWNLDSIPGWFVKAVNENDKKMAHRMNVQSPARPRWEDADKDYPKEEDRLRRGFGSVAWSLYGPGIKALEEQFDGQARVFVFGYDFREDNWKNGGHLLEFIYFTVHGEFGIKFKPIVVTHSMGGLVTRAACCRFFDASTGKAVDKKNGSTLKGEKMIAGVVHTLIPTYGTPKGYSAWRKGWGATPLGRIIGKNAEKFAARCYATPSLYQLAPSDLYPRRGRAADQDADNHKPYWLDFGREVFDKSERSPENKIAVRRAVANASTFEGPADTMLLRSRARETLSDVLEALNAYTADKTPENFQVLREALLRYPYLLYRDTSGWLGIPDGEYMKKHPTKAAAAKKCIDLAEQFHACRVGDYMHPKTWVLYSTQNEGTIVEVKVSGEPCKVENILGTCGDATVTDWSAAAFENKVRPPWNRRVKLVEVLGTAYGLFPCPSCAEQVPYLAKSCPYCSEPLLQRSTKKLNDLYGTKVDEYEKCVQVRGVEHDKAFEDNKCYDEIVKLVHAASLRLREDGFGDVNKPKYLAPEEWLGRFPQWTVVPIGKSQARSLLLDQKLERQVEESRAENKLMDEELERQVEESKAEKKLMHEKFERQAEDLSKIDERRAAVSRRSRRTRDRLETSLVEGERRDKEIAQLKEDIRAETKEREKDVDSIVKAIGSLQDRTGALEMKAHTHR